MKRLLPFLMTAGMLLACGMCSTPVILTAVSSPAAPTPTRQPLVYTATRRPAALAPTATVGKQPTETPGVAAGGGTTLVQLHLTDGPLMEQLAEHAGQAALLGQMAVVEFTAEW